MRDVYRPQAHVHLEARQNLVREKIIELLEGKIVLPLEVRSIAADPKVQSENTDLRKLMAAWLRGEAITKVSTKD